MKMQSPHIDISAFIAPGAQVMGDVTIKPHASIWYNCVLRADINRIVIGKETNIQDGSVLHVDHDLPCIVGNYVTVGHNAILHGCTIEDYCLIGMGAIILNGAVIRKGAVVGAGAVVSEYAVIEPNSLYVGIPAKFKKTLDPSVMEQNKRWTQQYRELAQSHKNLPK